MKDVLVDFDGVLNSYSSGWKGPLIIPDSPNPGAIAWLRQLIKDSDLNPIIWTSRVHILESEDPRQVEAAKGAIRGWLYLNGLSADQVEQLEITDQKKPAVLIIDDRAFQFQGEFPSRDYIKDFDPQANRRTHLEQMEELRAKVQYLVDYIDVTSSGEGEGFFFPDGDHWPASQGSTEEETPMTGVETPLPGGDYPGEIR